LSLFEPAGKTLAQQACVKGLLKKGTLKKTKPACGKLFFARLSASRIWLCNQLVKKNGF
jgi:hypothetical protein